MPLAFIHEIKLVLLLFDIIHFIYGVCVCVVAFFSVCVHTLTCGSL